MTEDSITIKDCRGKEFMIVSRYGGDVKIDFWDEWQLDTYIFVFKMKRNTKKNWKQIKLLFKQIKKLTDES